MLKQSIALVFLIAFALQTFNRAMIILDYKTNTAAYAKNCENKAQPALQCNGKCQMMKRLKQEQKKDEENPERKLENKNEIVLSSKSFFPVLVFAAPQQQQKSFPLLTTGHAIKMPRTLLRPPIC